MLQSPWPYALPDCFSGNCAQVKHVSQTEHFRLLPNGSLEITRRKSRIFSSSQFCVALSNFSGTVSDFSGKPFGLFNATYRVCPKEDLSPIKYFIFTRAFPICCSVSNLFLVLTFVTYCLIPDLRKPTFGKITMIFVVALFSAYLVK